MVSEKLLCPFCTLNEKSDKESLLEFPSLFKNTK
jgi:hypothetical protein